MTARDRVVHALYAPSIGDEIGDVVGVGIVDDPDFALVPAASRRRIVVAVLGCLLGASGMFISRL